MPYTPYALQTILPQVTDIAFATTVSPTSSTSFFSRRGTSLPNNEVKSTHSPPNTSNTAGLSSAFRSASSAPLIPGIESVEAYDTNLYLGTADGHILHYTLDEQAQKEMSMEIPFTANRHSVKYLGFGKKPVERILALPQVSKAVVLCDSTLSFYTLPTFDPLPLSMIDLIKGVACFTHDVATEGRIGEDGKLELCVVKRRVIQMYKIGELVELKKEVPLPDGAIMATRFGGNICVADDRQYKIINLYLSMIVPLIPTPTWPPSPSSSPDFLSHSRPCPVAAVIRDGEFLILSASENSQTIGIFVNEKGEPTRGTLQWPSYPRMICVEYPYIATLLRNNTIEIHNVMDQVRLQVITLDSSFDACGMSMGIGVKVHIQGLADRLRKRIWPSPVGEALLEGKDHEMDMALRREAAMFSTMSARILVYSRRTVMALHIVPLIVQADALLETNRVEEALQAADQTVVNTSSETHGYVYRLKCELDYIYQKCGLLLLKETLFEDAFARLAKGNIDPRVVIHLFPRLSVNKYLFELPRIVLFHGIQSMIDSMKNIDTIVTKMADDQSLNKSDSNPTDQGVKLHEILLKNAEEAVERYLRNERSRRSELVGRNDTINQAIDAALVRIYINEPTLLPFLKGPNDCVPFDCIEPIMEAKRFYALVLLYQSKSMYSEMLDVWTRLYSGEFVDPEFKDNLEHMKQWLLQDLGSHDVSLEDIARYTWWFTEQSPTEGVDLLVKSPATANMDPDDILLKLEVYGNDAVRTFLEYLVLKQQNTDAKYHTRLARSYIYDVQQFQSQLPGNEVVDFVDMFQKHMQDGSISHENGLDTFVGYLTTLRDLPLARKRLDLLRFLQRSPHYAADTLIDIIKEAGPLQVEEAIVLGRLGRHEDALRLLVEHVEDFVGAETYCITRGQSVGNIPDLVTTETRPNPTPARSSSLTHHVLSKTRTDGVPDIHLDDDGLDDDLEDNITPEQHNELQKLCTLLFKLYLKKI